MRRILFLLLTLVLILHYFNKEEDIQTYEVICKRSNGEIENIDLETYVMGVVAAEMPISFEEEALKAQSVAARTFVLSRDLKVDDTTNSQVYLDKSQRKERWKENFDTYEKKLKKVIDATKGEVLTYDDAYISALFFSSSSGKTENNEDYFDSSAIPYLRSVSSDYEKPIVEYNHISTAKLIETFGGSYMVILSYTKGGSVNEVRIGDTIYSGREVREKLGLNSSCFDIVESDDGYSLTTYGFGHQVGMSQYGANGMAKEGFSYKEILRHYYQEVCIKTL